MHITANQQNSILRALQGDKEAFNQAYECLTADQSDTDWASLAVDGIEVHFMNVELVAIFAGVTVTEFA